MPRAEAAIAALAAFGVDRASRPVRLQSGSLNRNYRVKSTAAMLFLRRHREGIQRTAVEGEHRIIRRAAELGIPVALPLEGPGGETAVSVDGSAWSLFPWVDGRQLIRGRPTVRGARALGELLGTIHEAFADEPYGPEIRLTWNAAVSAERLERIARSPMALERPDLRAALLERLRLLELHGGRSPDEFSKLPMQLCHGDFHDRQVIFARQEARPLAVIDWEMAGSRPRTWELIRSLVFARLDREPALGAFCAGYARHVRIPPDEAAMGVELWWEGRLHETWALEEYFLKGNQRVRRFVPDGFRHPTELVEPGYRARLALAIAKVR